MFTATADNATIEHNGEPYATSPDAGAVANLFNRASAANNARKYTLSARLNAQADAIGYTIIEAEEEIEGCTPDAHIDVYHGHCFACEMDVDTRIPEGEQLAFAI